MGVEEVSQRKCGFLAAAVFYAGAIDAQLTALGRVDPIEADSLAVNFNRVAVDDGCNTDYWPRQGRRPSHQCHKEG